MPLLNPIPGPNTLENQSCDNFRLSNLLVGIDTSTALLGFPSSILTLPNSKEYTMQNLITNKVTVSSMPITPEAYDFHPSKPLGMINSFFRIDG